MNQPTYLLSCHFATSLELLFVHFKDFMEGKLTKNDFAAVQDANDFIAWCSVTVDLQ